MSRPTKDQKARAKALGIPLSSKDTEEGVAERLKQAADTYAAIVSDETAAYVSNQPRNPRTDEPW